MSGGKELLLEDVYNFLGHEIGIQSNSQGVLEYLRFIYDRFYLGGDRVFLDPLREQRKAQRLTVRIIDNLKSSNELLINDNYHLYRLLKKDGSYHIRGQNLRTLAYDTEGFCDPPTIIQSALLQTISFLTKDYHLFHAGAVSWDDGGIIFPASPRMGKTTLVIKLVTLGFKFLSDEVACLDSNRGVLEPFPRKINIRFESQSLLGLKLVSNNKPHFMETKEWESTVDIDEIAPTTIGRSCPIRYVLFLRGFGEKPSLEYISASKSLFELINSSISPIDDRASVLFKFAPHMDRIQSFNLVIGNLDETSDLIMRLFDGKIPD
jgi:hypothetical protein